MLRRILTDFVKRKMNFLESQCCKQNKSQVCNMNILHISYQWPNIIYNNSGIFIKSTLHNLIRLTEHKYSLFVANKTINKEYLKEKKFTFRNYLRFLFSRDYYSKEMNLVILRKLYFPLFGISSLGGYNAHLCWLFVGNSLIRFIQKNEINIIHAHFSNPDGTWP